VRPSRMLLTLALALGMSGVAYVAQLVEPAGAKMCETGAKFVAGLSDDQKTKALGSTTRSGRIGTTFPFKTNKNARPARACLFKT
jgi:hypothetical protein